MQIEEISVFILLPQKHRLENDTQGMEYYSRRWQAQRVKKPHVEYCRSHQHWQHSSEKPTERMWKSTIQNPV